MRVAVNGLVIIMKTLDSWRPGVVRISLLSPPPHGEEQAGTMMVWPGASCRGGWCQDCAIKINVSSAPRLETGSVPRSRQYVSVSERL